MVEKKEPILLAALRARIGDWIYYITLQDLLQRAILESRPKEIANYLNTQTQRFFNALVIGTYGGDPKWSEFAIEESLPFKYDIPPEIRGTIGFLILEGEEKLFPIDGQHRIEGIKLAVKQNPELGEEDVCILFVRGITAGSKSEDPEGFERTRRLFTTLNRYAKPVNPRDIIALDEDDSVAITTRSLIENYKLFRDKTSTSLRYSLGKTDQTNFTSIRALYAGLNIFLRDRSKSKWRDFLKRYPGKEKETELYNKSIELWEYLCKVFEPVNEMKLSDPDEKVASKYRNSGSIEHLLFRPIGIIIILEVIRMLMDKYDLTLQQSIDRISKITMDITKKPWVNIIWNPISNKMMTRHRVTARKILYYSVGGNLKHMRTNVNKLKERMAAIQNRDVSEINLQRKLESLD